MRIGIGGPRLQPLDELILVFHGAVNLSFLRPPLQPRVDLRGRDPAFLGDADDVLVIRDAIGSREVVDDVPDRVVLFAVGLADAGLYDVDVEATLLARDLAHPVLSDSDRALRVVAGHRFAQSEAGAGFRETNDRLELPRGDGDARPRGFSRFPDLQIFSLDDPHRFLRHHREEALRIRDILSEEIR